MGEDKYYIILKGLPKRQRDSPLYWDIRKSIYKRYDKASSTFLQADGNLAVVIYDEKTAMEHDSRKAPWFYNWKSVDYAVRSVPVSELCTVGVIKVYGDDIEIRTASDSLNLPSWPFVVICRSYNCIYLNFTQVAASYYEKLKIATRLKIQDKEYRVTAEDKEVTSLLLPEPTGDLDIERSPSSSSSPSPSPSPPPTSSPPESSGNGKVADWSRVASAWKPKLKEGAAEKPDATVQQAELDLALKLKLEIDALRRTHDTQVAEKELEHKAERDKLREDLATTKLTVTQLQESYEYEKKQRQELAVQNELFKRLLHESQTYRFKMESDLRILRQTLVARALLEDIVKNLKEKCQKTKNTGCREAMRCECDSCKETFTIILNKLKSNRNIVGTFSIETLRKTLAYAYERFSKVAHPTEKKPIVADIHSDHHIELALVGCAMFTAWPLEAAY